MKYPDLCVAAYEANMGIRDAGLIVLTWGNASAADHDAGVFAIKPSGVAYSDLAPEKMVVVEIDTGHVVEGDLRPSSDTPTHLRLYQSFSSIGGVIHTHSIYATSFAQASREIPCMGTTHADHFDGPVPIARQLMSQEISERYEAATGDAIVERVESDPRGPLAVPAILLPQHGPFVWGATVSEAVRNAVALEAVAQMALNSLAICSAGSEATLQHELLEKHQQRKHGPAAYYGQPDDAE